MASVTAQRGANVIRLSSDGTADITINESLQIQGVRFQAGTSSSVTIKDKDASGTILYYADGTADLYEEIPIVASSGINVALVNASADLVVYLYLRA